VKTLPRWPLFLIALPAAVAVWSGWVGIGQLCGFGAIHPLPGIWDSARLNTAITLPIGVEAYGSYALSAWLDSSTPEAARKFAKWSAIGSLALGVLGQVAYHLLSAAHATRAPWPVVVLVSSLPVIVLGFGAALSHLLRSAPGAPEAHPETVPEVHGEPVPAAPAPVPVPEPAGTPLSVPERTRPSTRTSTVKPVRKPANGRTPRSADPVRFYADDLANGSLPSLRKIRADLKVGGIKAKQVQEELSAVLAERVPIAA
jgi:hypothetical protein